MTTSLWLFHATCGKVAATCLSVQCFVSALVHSRQQEVGSSAIVKRAVKTLPQICLLVFLSQIRVTASVNSFDPKYLHSNNLHFCVVYLLHTWIVKALTENKLWLHLSMFVCVDSVLVGLFLHQQKHTHSLRGSMLTRAHHFRSQKGSTSAKRVCWLFWVKC